MYAESNGGNFWLYWVHKTRNMAQKSIYKLSDNAVTAVGNSIVMYTKQTRF